MDNDTYLSISHEGGCEFFDVLSQKVQEPKIFIKKHFDNSNKERHFEYGEEYATNKLIFDDIPEEIYRICNPFDSCSSAQVLIKKVKEDVVV